MGQQPPTQRKLYITGFSLEKRIRKDHPLRKIVEVVDFDFIYAEVKNKYGKRGNVSVPPPVILKLMLLLIFYNVRSERELMATLPERLDWLWFLGLDLEDDIPNHSVLSKPVVKIKGLLEVPVGSLRSLIVLMFYIVKRFLFVGLWCLRKRGCPSTRRTSFVAVKILLR